MRRLLLLASAMIVAGCGMSSDRRGSTVIFASGADLQGMNSLITTHPLARQVQRYVLLTTLVRRDSAMQVEPYLARRWSWTDDGRTLTMALHPTLRWHDGAPTTSHDVQWTLDAARDPATGYPRLAELANLARVDAPDDTTVVLRFTSAPGAIPDVLTDLAILPRHLLRVTSHARMREAGWNRSPVGNGPYRFVRHEPNRRWVFDADPGFPAELGGPPHVRRLVIAVVDEPTTKLAALASGELDFAGINPAHARFVAGNPDLAVIDYPLLFTYVIAFNTRRPPFDEVRVRRTIASALDRAAIVDGYLFGFGVPGGSAVPPPLPGSIVAERMPAGASVAARAGAAPIRFELLTVGSGDAPLEQMIQSQLERVGFDVTIRQLELTSFLDRVHGVQHQFDAAVMGVTGDPELRHLEPLVGVTGMGPWPRDEMQRLISDSVPVTFLYHARGVQGANRRVRGVQMDMRGELATISAWRVE